MEKGLFKAKRKDGKGWAYGYLFENHGQSWILVPDEFCAQGCSWEEVVPQTVGQYTFQNDKNGTGIYTGDIMLLGNDPPRKTVIEYDPSRAEFKARLEGKLSIQMCVSFWRDGIIIGNIYDDCELA